jgi:hypothetical protein
VVLDGGTRVRLDMAGVGLSWIRVHTYQVGFGA